MLSGLRGCDVLLLSASSAATVAEALDTRIGQGDPRPPSSCPVTPLVGYTVPDCDEPHAPTQLLAARIATDAPIVFRDGFDISAR